MTKQEFIPRPYQKVAIDHLWDTRCAALFLDVGMGKTPCVTSVIARSVREFDTTRWLIVAPKMVTMTTYVTELQTKWQHTEDLRVCSLVNLSAKERGRKASQYPRHDVTIINVDLLKWLVDYFKHDWPYDGVVIDESSKFKDSSTKRFKSLRWVMPAIDRMILLTGSPCAQGMLSLWSQSFLLDRGEALGKTFGGYKDTYFTSDYLGYTFTLKPGAEDRIIERIKPRCLTMRALDYNDLPPVLTSDVEVFLDPKVLADYNELEKEFLLEIGDTVFTAMTAGVLVGKLQQIANGVLYRPEQPRGSTDYTTLHDVKLDALGNIIDEMNGNPFLLGYHFIADWERIHGRFPDVEKFDGTEAQMARWQRGEIPVLALHPQSGGHGVDGLQHATCTVVWFAPPWSREQYDQLNGRVTGTRQLGTPFEKQPARVQHIVAKGTIDERIVDVLHDRGGAQDRLLGALRRQHAQTLSENKHEQPTR